MPEDPRVYQDALICALSPNLEMSKFNTAVPSASDAAIIVKTLLLHGADPVSRGCCGYPFLLAAVRGNVGALKECLQRGMDVNLNSGHYGNALHLSAIYDQGDALELLLKHGVHFYVRDSVYGNALQAAVSSSSIDAVRILLQHLQQQPQTIPRLDNVCLERQCTTACRFILRMLLDSRISINAARHDNRVVFMCDQRHTTILKWVFGAQFWTIDDRKDILEWCQQLSLSHQGPNPLMFADELARLDSDFQSLHETERLDSNFKICQFLVSVINRMNEPVVIQTITARDKDCLSARVDFAGWHKTVPMIAGTRCLHQPWHHKHVGGVATSPRRHAKFDGELNMLQAACNIGDEEIVKILLDAGVNVNIYEPATMPPLHISCLIGSSAPVRALIDAGAHINTEYGDYGTALHVAASGGHSQIIPILLEAGADIELTSSAGSIALQIAVRMNKVDTARLLLQLGGNETAVAGSRDVIETACVYSGMEMIRMLLQMRPDLLADNERLMYMDLLHRDRKLSRSRILRALLNRTEIQKYDKQQIGKYLAPTIQSMNEELLLTLLEFGAEVNLQKLDRESPLYWSVLTLNLETFGMLLTAGAVVDAQVWLDFSGQLKQSAKGAHKARFNRGTMLQAIVGEDNYGAALLLLAAGADNEVEGDFGNAVQVARKFGNHGLAEDLEKYRTRNLGQDDNGISQQVEAIKDELFLIKQKYQYLRERQPPGSVEHATSRTLYKPSRNLNRFDDSDFEIDWAESGSELNGSDEDFLDDLDDEDEIDDLEQTFESGTISPPEDN